MAVPTHLPVTAKPTWCYISSGTWSLMGAEVPEPVISAECEAMNFTNEGGVGGTTRLLKNIAGLWLVQECRRVWKRGGQDWDWKQLVTMAGEATPLRSIIDPDHPDLVAPDDMPAAIRKRCAAHGEPIPETPGAVIRCALESLALRYRAVLGMLEKLTDGKIGLIHVVGGGSQNELLNQWTADACKRPVIAGPTEATAIGNLMSQIVSTGDAAGIPQAREIVRNSFSVAEYTPRKPDAWDQAFGRFQRLLQK